MMGRTDVNNPTVYGKIKMVDSIAEVDGPFREELTNDIYYTNIWYQMAGFNRELVLASTGAINSTTLNDITEKANLTSTTINNSYGVDNHINIYYGNTQSHQPSGPPGNYIFLI